MMDYPVFNECDGMVYDCQNDVLTLLGLIDSQYTLLFEFFLMRFCRILQNLK